MRLSRVRLTVRSAMVAVALLAPAFWAAERRTRFQRLAGDHFLRSSADVVCCVVRVTDDGKETSLRYEATASGRVTRRASSDPACIARPKGIGSPSGKALSGRRGSLCTSGRTCPMCGGTASTTS